MSRRFIEELYQFSPHVEQYSIDEAFVRLDGLQHRGLTGYGKTLRDTIQRNIGLPLRVGIGATGIGNALQLADKDSADMRRLWNVGLARTVLELQGIACISPGDIDEKRKQILSSRSFGSGISKLDELKAALAFHCQRAGEKLRKQGSQASVVGVFLRTNRYKELPQHNKSCVRTLVCPSQDSYKFLASALEQLDEVYRPGFEYQKIGVILDELTDAQNDNFQLDMFDISALEEMKRRDLMAITDKVNARFKNGIKPASVIGSTNWHMRQAFRSNRWTTRLDELQVAKC